MPAVAKTKANTRKPVSNKKKAEEEALRILHKEGGGLGNPGEPETALIPGLERPKLQGGKVEQGIGEGVKAAESAVKETESWGEAVGNFFHNITQVHLWERIGKIMLGIIVLVFGIYFFARAMGAPSGGQLVVKAAKARAKAGTGGPKAGTGGPKAGTGGPKAGTGGPKAGTGGPKAGTGGPKAGTGG